MTKIRKISQNPLPINFKFSEQDFLRYREAFLKVSIPPTTSFKYSIKIIYLSIVEKTVVSSFEAIAHKVYLLYAQKYDLKHQLAKPKAQYHLFCT